MRKSIDIDALWKEFLTEFLEDSIAVLNPDLHQMVDWSIPPQYLEQELFNALRGKYKIKDKRKFTDKLVKLSLKSGTEHFVLLHAEAQHEPEDNFNRRMYVYRSLIYLRYDIEDITAIAIFTGTPPDLDTLDYRHFTFGTELIYRFNSYIIAYQKESELIKSDNPFLIATLAALYVYKTKNDVEKRFAFKRKLFSLAQKKNINKEKILKLLIFVKEFLHLPDDLELEFEKTDFSKFINNVPMVTYSEGTMRMLDQLIHRWTGKTIKEYKALSRAADKAETERKKVEAENRKIEAENRKIEAENRKIEAENRKIEAKNRKIEAELIRIEFERKKAVWNLYTKIGLTAELIADSMNLDLQYVQSVIEENKKLD